MKDADPEMEFLSPSNCPQNVLKKFPPTHILTAGNDPLRDEQYKFVLKLINSGVDIKCKEYLCFPHGFLSFDLPIGGIDECSVCIKDSIGIFKEFINKDKKEDEQDLQREKDQVFDESFNQNEKFEAEALNKEGYSRKMRE